jgi:hypothetical protein
MDGLQKVNAMTPTIQTGVRTSRVTSLRGDACKCASHPAQLPGFFGHYCDQPKNRTPSAWAFAHTEGQALPAPAAPHPMQACRPAVAVPLHTKPPTADAGRLEASPCAARCPTHPAQSSRDRGFPIQAHNRPKGPTNAGRTALRVGSRARPRHKVSPSCRLSRVKKQNDVSPVSTQLAERPSILEHTEHA